MLIQLGSFEKAIIDLNEAVRLDPENPLAHKNLGNLYFAKGQYSEACQQFDAALMLDPTNTSARAGLIIARYALGQVNDAKAGWLALIDIDGNYLDARWVGKELEWRPELIAEARALIASLDS